jgi:Fungal Zn(2)-Cys(6) binuclear cluster domain
MQVKKERRVKREKRVKKERKYVTNACTSCRQKKIKCDDNDNCKNCERRDIECVRKPLNRRGPKPKDDKII